MLIPRETLIGCYQQLTKESTSSTSNCIETFLLYLQHDVNDCDEKDCSDNNLDVSGRRNVRYSEDDSDDDVVVSDSRCLS